jgi:hypothetical protein
MSLYEIAKLSTFRSEDFKFGGKDNNVFTIEHSFDDDDAPITVSLYDSTDDCRTIFEIDPAYNVAGITLQKSNFGQPEEILNISVDKHELLLLLSAVKGVLDACG